MRTTFSSATGSAVIAISLIATLGCSASRPAPSSQPVVSITTSQHAMHAEIDSLNRAMVAAFDSSPAKVARFYADSARIVGPRRQEVRGREAIDRYWASIRTPAQWSLTVVEVGGDARSAHQVGISRLTSPGRADVPSTYECDFVVLWRRQADGTMRITLDLYN